MTTLTIDRVSEPDFTAEAVLEPDGITAALTGNADLRSKQSLDGFIRALHAEAARLHVREVRVDLRELKFMNSSCFKNFVWWLTQLEDGALDAQYKIRFLADPKLHWQRRSLHALTCFATELVTVQA